MDEIKDSEYELTDEDFLDILVIPTGKANKIRHDEASSSKQEGQIDGVDSDFNTTDDELPSHCSSDEEERVNLC